MITISTEDHFLIDDFNNTIVVFDKDNGELELDYKTLPESVVKELYEELHNYFCGVSGTMECGLMKGSK